MSPDQNSTVLTFLESAPLAVVVVDVGGRIVLVNAKTEELFGYPRGELINQPLEDLLPQRLTQNHHRLRSSYFATPTARPMGSGMDLAARRKDGTEFPVEIGLSYVELEGQRLTMSFITDITARVEAAEALRQHAQELEIRVAARTQEIERRRRVAEGLRDVLTILNTARPLEEILDLIVEQASQLLETDAIAIYRQDREGDVPHVQAARYLGNPEGYRSVLKVPLNVQSAIYGNICLYYTAARSFTQEEKELAIAFADQAALAIENGRLREQVGRSAVAAERNRLARDLHDAVTQTLFSTSIIAEVLPTLWEKYPEEGRRQTADLQEMTRGALAEMRTLLLELRPTALTQAKLSDLLHQLADAITGRVRIPVTVEISGQYALPSDVQIAFYRIAQEALNNIAKHSRASQATVRLEQTANHIGLTIEDDGRGFDPSAVPATHLGLNIMRERAQSIGADLTIASAKGQHTSISVSWTRADGSF